MAAIIIPIIILVAIVGFSSGGSILENLNFSTPGFNIDLGFGFSGFGGKKTVSQGTQAPQSSFQSAPSIFLDTVITDGPSEGARIIQTTTATFEFSGHMTPEDTGDTIKFDTKIVGFDEDWKSTSKTQRKVTLPPGIQNYTFLVRARVGGVVDSTPASRAFQTYTSPYFGKVDISRVTIPTKTRNSKITLSTKLALDEKVNITGCVSCGCSFDNGRGQGANSNCDYGRRTIRKISEAESDKKRTKRFKNSYERRLVCSSTKICGVA